MVKGTTKSGFSFEIDPSKVDDMEFLERLGAADNDITKMPGIIAEVLGAEQRAKLYDHMRNDSGNVPIGATITEFQEILTIANESEEAKN